jgi:hypothetical protein
MLPGAKSGAGDAKGSHGIMPHLQPAGGDRKRKKRIASQKAKQRNNAVGQSAAAAAEEAALNPAPAGRLERTRRLILAALRVWELKRKIRD